MAGVHTNATPTTNSGTDDKKDDDGVVVAATVVVFVIPLLFPQNEMVTLVDVRI